MFITPPGATDILMVVTAIFLGACVVAFGLIFLRLHTLPERVAHRGHKIQFEIVAILGLIALFTHMHIFWVIGLLLAFIDIPDFGGFLSRIAGSVETIAGNKPDPVSEQEAAGVDTNKVETAREQQRDAAPVRKPARVVAGGKGLDHA
jgi:hypothetical protein